MSPTHESIFCQKNLSFSLKNMLFRQKMDSYEWGSRGGGESSKMVCGLMSFMDVPQACWSFFEQIGYKFSQQ